MNRVPLHDMVDGEHGIVLTNACHSSLTARLAELGLTEGEAITMIRRGTPMLVEIGNARLCLRDDDASTITVLRAE
ncbi:MAG: ferrous iron transport protein A [Deltaproteobacteria bacterium]|nr:ferrous iron transport protein A [Deltaproteobacteria bacterium]